MTPCEKHPYCTDDGTCACAQPCDGHTTCDKHYVEIVEDQQKRQSDACWEGARAAIRRTVQ